jgi:hypothetical protein
MFNSSIAIAWPFFTPSSVDSNLATSAWRKNSKALLNGKGSTLVTVIEKESYHHGQAYPADPPPVQSSSRAPFPAS